MLARTLLSLILFAFAVSAEEEPMPCDIWADCWNGRYFDFTQSRWTNLDHSQQFDYAQKYQSWFAKYKGLSIDNVEIKNGIRFEFRLIPPGKFWMGSADGDSNEKPVHKVLISEAFYMGKTEVTQAQWQSVMHNSPSHWKGSNLPVEQVSWEDCVEFCQNTKLKLPSEAQWEYACGGGVRAKYCFGDSESNLENYAWYSDNSSSKTHPAGEKQANAWGCQDMHGNVWEWCQDWHGEYPSKEVVDPRGPDFGSYRVCRGGCCYSGLSSCRSTLHGEALPSNRLRNSGFRLLKTAH